MVSELLLQHFWSAEGFFHWAVNKELQKSILEITYPRSSISASLWHSMFLISVDGLLKVQVKGYILDKKWLQSL